MSDIKEAVLATALVDYQEGSVVSRTLIKEKAGSLTLFSFDKGQALSEHSTPFDALLHVLEGEAEVTISGRPSLLRAGMLIRLPAGEPHAVRAVERFKMLLLMIRP